MSDGVDRGDQPRWQDLSKNQASQSVRKRAEGLRKEAPIRSVLARLLGSPRDEGHRWLGADGPVPKGEMSLAELFAIRNSGHTGTAAKKLLGQYL